LAQRFFYHSFPRPRTGEDPIAKGLAILKCFRTFGLVLGTEVVLWKQPTAGTPREIRLVQPRVCFTELGEAELPGHADRFGPFALEFEISQLRRIGALPVIYTPQQLATDPGYSAIAATIVAQTHDAKYAIDQLANLHATIQQVRAGPHLVPKGCPVNLQNTDDNGNVVSTSTIPIEHAEAMLSYLAYRNAPLALMSAVLGSVSHLFYPTDDQIHDEELAYYRQREWRVLAYLQKNGAPLARALTPAEQTALLAVDQRFWATQLTDGKRTFSRVDETRTIDTLEGKPVLSCVRRVLVPKAALKGAREMFSDAGSPPVARAPRHPWWRSF